MADSVYQTALAKLQRLGHKSKPLARLNTGDTPGPTILSRDPAKSAIAPSFVVMNNVDEVKDLGGVPDSEFEHGRLANDGLPIPEAFNQEITPDLKFSAQVCAALRTYIYGNSTLVHSYKEALNRLRFPMILVVHEAEDVIVTRDHPLIIEDDGHGNPIGLVFKKVTVEPGGQIIWRGAGGSLVAQELIFQQPTGGALDPEEQNFLSVGPGGKNGDDGKNGNGGAPGGDGAEGKDNKSSCDRIATDGTAGKDGSVGVQGTDGVNGGEGSPVNWKNQILTGKVSLGSAGGDGGKGGSGGAGGDGGKGGDGGAPTDHCSAGKGGEGGKGANGGNGGKGGNGGNGANIYVTYETGSPTFMVKPVTSGAGGAGGTGGTGGKGGAAGKYSGSGGQSGAPGEPGKPGNPGVPGQIFINNVLKT